MAADLAESPAIQPAADPAAELDAVRALAFERFPHEHRTLELFFEELTRRRTGVVAQNGQPGAFEDLLDRLEELLEALLVGEANGLRRA